MSALDEIAPREVDGVTFTRHERGGGLTPVWRDASGRIELVPAYGRLTVAYRVDDGDLSTWRSFEDAARAAIREIGA